METFIPILIAIVIFAFQAYANYQKEQDKARKRNLGQPPLPEDNAKHVKPAPADVPSPATSPAVRPAFEHYSGVMDPAEPTPSKYQRPLIPKRLTVETDAEVQPALDLEEFDLRDAIIKSVILDRPYK